MERELGQPNDGNSLIELATFFRERLEFAEMMLIEGASSEPDDDDTLENELFSYLEDARNTRFKYTVTLKDGRSVLLTCEMTVEGDFNG